MNSLIIHNDKSPFLEYFEYQIKFSSTNDIDKYITDSIIPKIKAYAIDKIYIKDSLSSNYLELLGLRVAYHIRLSVEFKERFLPIIILSDTNAYILNKITPLAQILFTKNIFIIQNTKEAIEKFSSKALNPLTGENYKTHFLDRIKISSPEESSHDIANEWGIYKWSKLVKAQNPSIKSNNKKISSMLYFKYLQAKYPLERTKTLGYKRTKLSGKILYIDDEWDKGWSDIFKAYFSKNSQIEFETFEYLYKDKNKFTMMGDIKEKVQSSNPDIIILDLRLTHTDHQNTDINMLSGIKIAKMIKEINAGIQIIMLSASSKNNILEKLYEQGILGYIKKEHPQDNDQNVKERIAKLADLVDEGLEKKYLKKIWKIQHEITIEDPKIQIEVKSVFEILNSSMQNRFIYAMFAIFKVIEIINDKYIEDGYRKATWKDTQEEFSDNSTKNKIQLILDKRLYLNNQKVYEGIENIIKIRNNTIHPKKGKVEEITENQIIDWFTMLQTILEKIIK